VHAQLQPDVVITLCDNAASEPCPAYFDQAIKAHWGLADPAAQQGTEEEINEVFDQAVQVIRARVEQFLHLPLANLQAEQLQQELRRIGLLLPEAAQK
jgi:arsenate reductase